MASSNPNDPAENVFATVSDALYRKGVSGMHEWNAHKASLRRVAGAVFGIGDGQRLAAQTLLFDCGESPAPEDVSTLGLLAARLREESAEVRDRILGQFLCRRIAVSPEDVDLKSATPNAATRIYRARYNENMERDVLATSVEENMYGDDRLVTHFARRLYVTCQPSADVVPLFDTIHKEGNALEYAILAMEAAPRLPYDDARTVLRQAINSMSHFPGWRITLLQAQGNALRDEHRRWLQIAEVFPEDAWVKRRDMLKELSQILRAQDAVTREKNFRKDDPLAALSLVESAVEAGLLFWHELEARKAEKQLRRAVALSTGIALPFPLVEKMKILWQQINSHKPFPFDVQEG